MKYHVISAKRFGWEDMYDHFSLRHLSLVSTRRWLNLNLEKMTEKNGRVFPYIGYEFDGETFYSVEYRGTATQQEYDDFQRLMIFRL